MHKTDAYAKWCACHVGRLMCDSEQDGNAGAQ